MREELARLSGHGKTISAEERKNTEKFLALTLPPKHNAGMYCSCHWFCGIVFHGGKCFVTLVSFVVAVGVRCLREGYFLTVAKVLPHFLIAC